MGRLVCAAALVMSCLSAGAVDTFLAITSPDCPPCSALHRDFDADPRLTWVDATPDTRAKHGVRAVPTVIAYKDGREIGRRVGYQGRRDMERWMHAMEEAPRRRF